MSDTDQSQVTSNQKKGRRHENEAKNILGMTYRFASRATDTASPNGTTDVFNCTDLIAVRPGWPVKFVQVKTNSREFSTSWVSAFIDDVHSEFELWSRFDRQGWEIFRFDPETKEFVEELQIDTCDTKEAGKLYREHTRNSLSSSTGIEQ